MALAIEIVFVVLCLLLLPWYLQQCQAALDHWVGTFEPSLLNICRGYQTPTERSSKGTVVLICVGMKDGCLQGQCGTLNLETWSRLWQFGQPMPGKLPGVFPFAGLLSQVAGAAGGKCHQLTGKPLRGHDTGNPGPCFETPLLNNEFPGSSVSGRLSMKSAKEVTLCDKASAKCQKNFINQSS